MKRSDVLYLGLVLIWLICVYIAVTTPYTQFSNNIVYMIVGFIAVIPMIYFSIMGIFKLLGNK
jgi:hypothetical protein